MKFFYLEPEVAGSFGPHTDIDASQHPPKIHKLEYLFDGWLGDVVLECYPCFIATKEACASLQSGALTGISYDAVATSTSEQFKELYPSRELPEFCWLKITGQAGKDDFGLAGDQRLVASKQAIDLLRSFKLDAAVISPFPA
jgi:hypothetical protein